MYITCLRYRNNIFNNSRNTHMLLTRVNRTLFLQFSYLYCTMPHINSVLYFSFVHKNLEKRLSYMQSHRKGSTELLI